ncbi:MATE family efflux transporter [Candidatus Sororendozoicomonas aggregata]|uniref:MATE family efflux transporter n=1 Tax=Candidatus Sororendozoicomonas aggregata TaxID=3073239 RepID=UPI002ED5BE89
MIKQILQQGLIISGTRLIALSMPMIDMMMLGRSTAEDVANFTVANQIIQVFVILIISLSVGINILVPKKNTKSSDINNIIGYSIVVGFIITLVSIVSGFLFLKGSSSGDVYYILVLGLFPLSVFVGISAIMESKGFTRNVLIITAIMSFSNATLNYILINTLPVVASNSVSLATTMLRYAFCFIIIMMAYKTSPVKIRVGFSRALNSTLLKYGKSESITSFFFTGSIAFMFYFLSKTATTYNIANLGVTFNFINTVFIVFVGFSISLTIFLSKKEKILITDIKKIVVLSLFYVASISLLLSYFSKEISHLYVNDRLSGLADDIRLSVLIIAIDGLAISLISILRVKGYPVLPPLFRLSFVVFGIPSGIALYSYYGNQGLILCLSLANAIALTLSIAYLMKIIMKSSDFTEKDVNLKKAEI